MEHYNSNFENTTLSVEEYGAVTAVYKHIRSLVLVAGEVLAISMPIYWEQSRPVVPRQVSFGK